MFIIKRKTWISHTELRTEIKDPLNNKVIKINLNLIFKLILKSQRLI